MTRPVGPAIGSLTVFSARSNAAIDTGDCGPSPSIMPPREKKPDSSIVSPRDAAALSSAAGVLGLGDHRIGVLRGLRFGLLAQQRAFDFLVDRRIAQPAGRSPVCDRSA